MKDEAQTALVVGEDGPGREVARQSDVHVGDLLAMAVEKNLDPDRLEKLLDLHERIRANDARSAFHEALSAFQDECPPLIKERTAEVVMKGGGAYTYTYATLPEIQRTVRPYLRKHGFDYVWDEEFDGQSVKVTCTLNHVLGHSSSASFAGPTSNPSKANDIQKVGMASTYGKRRSLMSVLGIEAEDDLDAASRDEMETITEADVEALRARISELSNFSLEAFLNYVGAPSLEEMPRGKLVAAYAALDRRREKDKAKGVAK